MPVSAIENLRMAHRAPRRCVVPFSMFNELLLMGEGNWDDGHHLLAHHDYCRREEPTEAPPPGYEWRHVDGIWVMVEEVAS
jgi:hypothetical protein